MMDELLRPEVTAVRTPTVLNLTVHGVGETSRVLEPGEDRTWVSVAQLEQVLDAVIGQSDVQITFDDGNKSDIEFGLPLLLERGLTAEFFVLAGLLGEPGRVDSADVRELLKAGMRVGSHGWAHRDWRGIRGEEITEEMVDAPRVLTDLTGRPVSRVAIPFGSYDRIVLRHLREVGVTRAYTSDSGPARTGSWLQARNSLRADMDPEWTRNLLDSWPSLPVRVRRFAARTVKRARG